LLLRLFPSILALLLILPGGPSAAARPTSLRLVATTSLERQAGETPESTLHFSWSDEGEWGRIVSAGDDGLVRLGLVLPAKSASEYSIKVFQSAREIGSLSFQRGFPPRPASGGVVRVEYVGSLRGVEVAIVALDLSSVAPSDLHAGFDVELSSRDAVTRKLGCSESFAAILSSLVLNPEAVAFDRDLLQPGQGQVVRCNSLAEVVSAGTDFLIVAADQFFESAWIDTLAYRWAAELGGNVAIVGTGILPQTTAGELKQFLQTVYDTKSSAHFGDGHLGGFVLIGDAYADDNQTVLMPDYDGYGGLEEASDHFYALLDGDDDFEDVFFGRLPVGNESELENTIRKIVSYRPAEGEAWSRRVSFLAGEFYPLKEDYEDLFSELGAEIPGEYSVDELYRADFANDLLCRQAVIAAFNLGYYVIDFSGDGYKWVWGGCLAPEDIDSLNNAETLPIVLSMACQTGWFDNTSESTSDGNVDCLAERLLYKAGGGAIGVVASSRNSDGGIFRTLNKFLLRGLFTEGCTRLGEAFQAGRYLHLLNSGDIQYLRQFNLFGDPFLTLQDRNGPGTKPDLVVRPYQFSCSPPFPSTEDVLELRAVVWNEGNVTVGPVQVRFYEGDSTSGLIPVGSDLEIASIPPWGADTVFSAAGSFGSGVHTFAVILDPGGAIDEFSEANNYASISVNVASFVDGYPVAIGAGALAITLADVDASSGKETVVMTEGGGLIALGADGHTLWERAGSIAPIDWYGELAPAAGDVAGDEVLEVLQLERGRISLLRGGELLWSILTDDLLAAPSIVDLDGDGKGEIVVATRNSFFGNAQVACMDSSGATRWSLALPQSAYSSGGLCFADLDADGLPEVVIPLNTGELMAVEAAGSQPQVIWSNTSAAAGFNTSALAGDLDFDGDVEILVGGAALCCFDSGGNLLWSAPLDSTAEEVFLCDAPGSVSLEAAVMSSSGRLCLFDAGGVELWSCATGMQSSGHIATGDLNGDGSPEFVISSSAGEMMIVDASGEVLEPAIEFSSGALTACGMGDLDGDGTNEVVFGTADSSVCALSYGGGGFVDWGELQGGASHLGCFAQPVMGVVGADRVWQGRVLVVGDYVVQEGCSLTVASGAEVLVSANDVLGSGLDPAKVEIEAGGGLSAVGTAGSPITFTGYPRAGGGWRGLGITGAGSGRMKWFRVSGADFGIQSYSPDLALESGVVSECGVGLRAVRSTVSAKDVTVSGCELIGIVAFASDLDFEQSTVKGCGGGGVGLVNCNEVRFQRVSVSSTSSGDGIKAASTTLYLTGGTEVYGNSGTGVSLSGCHGLIDSTSVHDNGALGVLFSDGSDLIVHASSFYGNYVGIKITGVSVPNLGTVGQNFSGSNSIFSNERYAVSNVGAAWVYAQNNWWGGFPLSSSVIYGKIVTAPALPEPGGWGHALAGAERSESRPGGFRVFPNPARFTSGVTFAIGGLSRPVSLSFFDVSGRLVRRAEMDCGGAGDCSFLWDGTDGRGRRLPSGVYFVKVDSGGVTESAKVILLR